LVIVTMIDVASRVLVVTPGEWTTEPMPGIPPNTDTAIADADDLADEVFLSSASFITPPRLFHRAAGAPLEQTKSAPAFFDADGIDSASTSRHQTTERRSRTSWWHTKTRANPGLPFSTGTVVRDLADAGLQRFARTAVAGPRL